jgi:hypothetical protein
LCQKKEKRKNGLLDYSNFLQSKVGKTEDVVITERAYTILEIMSIQGYKMWTNELRAQEEFARRRRRRTPGPKDPA